jgi:hypothetical protein
MLSLEISENFESGSGVAKAYEGDHLAGGYDFSVQPGKPIARIATGVL